MNTSRHHEADVAIVGAGPVGLTLAIDLSRRGHCVLLLESRAYGEPPSVKCNHVAARTMEQFRRLGLAERIRSTGLPEDFPNDVAFRTSFTGQEIGRIPIPCRRDRFTDRSGPDGWWPTPEPPHRINQIFLEPLLLEHAASRPGVTLLSRVRADEIEPDDDGVTVRAEDLDGGGRLTVRAKVLVGCDGGRSLVRKSIGATLSGTPVVQRVQSTLIRAPQLLSRLQGPPSWGSYSLNPRRCGTVFAIDGIERWLIHNHLAPDEDETSVDRDASIRTILGVEADFPYEVLSQEDWIGRRLVADRFRQGRVFLAGDAAHLWIPYAGYGMNAGIADAMNLSWHLSAWLRGWADAAVLDAYERERQPITEQVAQFAMDHALQMIKAKAGVPAGIEDPGPEADAVRQRYGQEMVALNVLQFCCGGLNFGYFYDRSPLIAYDGEAAPAYSMGGFEPSTVPGCRAPHFTLADGRSLYDAFGDDYTLLCFGDADGAAALQAAARDAGLPLVRLDIDRTRAEVPDVYRHALVLCRVDQHIAWRGDALTDAEAAALVARCRGRP
jgi:2-polyprenyl-6-methoxyphenol hydroxylase-like FAD-dependent oxidoreductase